MESSGSKLSIWTEGLDEEWKLSSEQSVQIDRGHMTPAEVCDSIERIRAFNGDTVDCRLLLKHQESQLDLSFVSGKILASDPHNMNYQSVEILPSEFVAYLETQFGISDQDEALSNNPVRLIEWCVLGTFLLILGLSIFYANRFLDSRSRFLPLPKTVEFDNQDARKHLEHYAGIYVTRVRDGGMAIELNVDGSFGFYDLARIGPTVYQMKSVNAGKFRPVLISGRLALLTENRFVFRPSGKSELDFLQRKFDKVGNNRADVPFMDFPN